MTQANGAQKIKAGDTVWHHETQKSISVAVVDDETGELAPSGAVEVWYAIGGCVLQTSCEFFAHRRTLQEWGTDRGRRGVVARRTLATLWSDGKLSRKGSTP